MLITMEYKLPRGRLSYSQISLWLKNKKQYRERYYEGKESIETPETMFGKHIARLLEDPVEIEKNPVLKIVPKFSVPEYKIEVEVEGVKVLGYIDSFNPDTNSFFEYKTSHTNNWNDLSVARHMQLPFYSFLIKKKHKKVDKNCELIWIETRWKKQQMEYEGHILEGTKRELELTGKIERFKRKIVEWERKWIKDLILTTAKEIHEDYEQYQKTIARGKEIYESIGQIIPEKKS